MYLANLTAEKHAHGAVTEAWATNLEYDLFNLFEPDRVPEIFLRFGRSALCGARWRRCEFRDTIRHVPVSVAQWGELVGIKKQHATMFRKGVKRRFEHYLARCRTDARITYHAATTLHEHYARLGTYPRMTLASTALTVWQQYYWRRKIFRPTREVWNAAKEAYHGGRTQAFHVGDFEKVTAIDAASMFPWAMIAERLPLPWGLYNRVGEGAPLKPLGIYRVAVRSDLKRPRLPVRTSHGTIYPNGQWRGWYVGEELLAFRAAGGKLRVLGGIEFLETCRPFKSYVAAMFAKKNRARGVSRLLFKLLGNALYGKFGQRGRVVRAIPLEHFLALRRAPLAWREWNGLAIYSQDGAPPPWGNMVWPAFVTARARIRLAAEMDRVEHHAGLPLYCDTDSVIFSGRGPRYPEKAKRPGTFEHRGEYEKAMIIGKKEYALRRGRKWESHAKGVPQAERFRYLLEGTATFSRPTRMREAARDGSIVNTWRKVTKVRRQDLIRYARSVDGALPIPWIALNNLPGLELPSEVVAVAAGLVATVGGLVAAVVQGEISPGGTIVIAAATVFGLAMVAGRRAARRHARGAAG